MNKTTLIPNVRGFSLGEPKFSLFINRTAAAAIKPMMAGRKPLKMSCTVLEFLWLTKYRLINIMMMNGSHMMDSEDMKEPMHAAHCG